MFRGAPASHCPLSASHPWIPLLLAPATLTALALIALTVTLLPATAPIATALSAPQFYGGLNQYTTYSDIEPFVATLQSPDSINRRLVEAAVRVETAEPVGQLDLLAWLRQL